MKITITTDHAKAEFHGDFCIEMAKSDILVLAQKIRELPLAHSGGLCRINLKDAISTAPATKEFNVGDRVQDIDGKVGTVKSVSGRPCDANTQYEIDGWPRMKFGDDLILTGKEEFEAGDLVWLIIYGEAVVLSHVDDEPDFFTVRTTNALNDFKAHKSSLRLMNPVDKHRLIGKKVSHDGIEFIVDGVSNGGTYQTAFNAAMRLCVPANEVRIVEEE